MDAYQYDFEHLKAKDQANEDLAKCRTWDDLVNVLDWTGEYDFILASKRRNGVMIYHMQKADIKRKGLDLAFYLVNDGVHAGACAVPNLHKFFFFRMSTQSELGVLRQQGGRIIK